MSLTSLYRCILDDVIKNVKPEFDAEGLEDTVLHELQQIWEERLQSATTVFNQEPYYGQQQQQQQQHHQQHHQQQQQQQQQYDAGGYTYAAADAQHQYPTLQHNDIYYQGQVPTYAQPGARYTPAPTATSSTSSSSSHTTPLSDYDHIGRPQQFMPPPRTTWSHDPTSITVSLNDNAHSRGTIPQRDGACDEDSATSTTTLSEAPLSQEQQQQQEEANALAEWNRSKQEFLARMHRNIPQVDGIVDGDGNDDGNDDDDDDDGNRDDEDGDGDAAAVAAKDDDDEELNSDLDDDDEVPESDHLVLCQFEKVIRIKNKRKCNLKDGVMRLNGRDYLFSKANGEFEF